MARKTNLICWLLALLFPVLASGEGVRELCPDSTNSSADLYITNGAFSGDYTSFGLINCPARQRLHIHVKEAGEIILFGLRSPQYNRTFNLRRPDGTIVMSGICPTIPGQTGFIQYYHQADVGPFPQLSGYTPFSYQVTNPADTGDYYFEIANLPLYYDIRISLWDFQVVSGNHTPPQPSDMMNGRVWSQSWQVNAELAFYRQFNGSFFVYSNDGIVTKLTLENARIGVATFFCNPYGCLNTGNFNEDRKSVTYNTISVFPEIADYKVFLNDPDSTLYPSGVYGQIIGTPSLIPDPAYPLCDRHKLISVDVNKVGKVEIIIEFPYGAPATTVSLYGTVQPGTNQIAWDGLDGLGNTIPDGTQITITVTYLDALSNLPIWDQEQNPDGYTISLARPVNPSGSIPKTYWDDTNIGGGSICPNGSNLTGCLPASTGCHVWSGFDCHDNMINTWWYASSSTISFTETFLGEIANAVGHGDSRCGAGSLLLHATVPPASTVDWYDSITGGTLLLAGDTSFITPVLFSSTTFYAEARSQITSCISQNRVAATATILPAPIPTIQGPDSICAGTTGHIYQTEPGKSNYEWWLSSGGVITTSTSSNTVSVTWNEPGHHTLFVNYTDPNGCPASDPAAYRVVVGAMPDTAGPVSGPTPLCAGGEDLVYSVDTIPWVETYIWSLPAGFTITNGIGTNSITVTVEPTAASGEITVYGTNICGDGGISEPFHVTVTHSPSSEAGPGDTVCQGSAYTVSGASASDYSSLLWISNGEGTLQNESSLSPTYYPEENETGAVTLTIIALNPPCLPDSSFMTLWIEPSVTADAGPDLSSCSLSPVSLAGGQAANYQSLHWTTSGTGTFDDPSLLHPYYIPTSEDVASGMVTLTLTANAESPCPDISDPLQLTFSLAPEGEAGPDGVICQGEMFQVTGTTATHYSALLWEHSGSGILEENTSLNPIYIPSSGESGIVILTLSIRGEGACSDSLVTKQLQLLIYALEVDAGNDHSVDSGSVVSLMGLAEAGSGEYEVHWEPAGMVENPGSFETETLPIETSTWFTLTVTDQVSGCSRSDSLWIEVAVLPPPPPPTDCLEIYNVITPNGDGVNDTWIITCIELHPENSVQIINRWGDRIRSFERYDNVGKVWDGTNQKGEAVPDGTYYYVLSIKDMDPKTGWIFVRGGSR
ncbi:gliding motility-associated C-terminal domain-containing protein [Bacteroidota bacterium]